MKALLPCSIIVMMLVSAQTPSAYGQATPDSGGPARLEAQATQTQPPDSAPSSATVQNPAPDPAPAPAVPRSQPAAPKLDIMLVLDNSGSMKRSDPDFLTKKVVESFLEKLDGNVRLGIVIFDRAAQLAKPLTAVTDPEARAGFLQALDQVNYRGRFTNSPAGIERAIYELKTGARKDASKTIIFLTDGVVDTGSKLQNLEREKWLQEALAPESQQVGIRIFGIAFTERADVRLLQTLALKTNGEYFRAYRAEDIQGVFSTIYERVSAAPAAPAVSPQPAQAPPSPASPPVNPAVSTAASPAPAQASPSPASPPPTPQQEASPWLSTLIGIGALGALIAALLIAFKNPPRKVSLPKPPRLSSMYAGSSFIYPLTKKSLRIGRTGDNDIIIPQSSVSALHAVIECKDDFFYLEDQRSRNGTWLNNKRLKPNKPVRLKSGDRIKFDVYEFRFDCPDQAAVGGTAVLSLKDRRRIPPYEPPFRPESAPAAGPSTTGAPASDEERTQPPGSEAVSSKTIIYDTTLKRKKMCTNHPLLEATELCSMCKKPFCLLCVTEQDEKVLCADCMSRVAPLEQKGA